MRALLAGQVFVAMLVTSPGALGAQDASLPPLRFLGIEAGLSLSELQRTVTTSGGKPFRCDRSRRDPSVQECLATIRAPGAGVPLALWASVIDSATGILTLSAPVTGSQLDEWKARLEADYGQVGARVQGSQWMMQWVRQGRMIRLTWRIEHDARIASVSLVDGLVLDAWGRRTAHRPMPRQSPTPAIDTTRVPGAGGGH